MLLPPRPPRRPPPARVAGHLFNLIFAAIFVIFLVDGTPAQDDDEVLRVRTDLVTVPFYVTDRRGRRVTGLTQADFQVRHNGRLVSLSYFAPGTDRVALLFALDASGSAREHIAQQRETALAVFAHFGSASRAAVLAFSEQPELKQDFTPDLELARRAFALDARRNGRTAIFDAAVAAARAFDRGAYERLERRIVVLLSDGLDTASRTQPRRVIDEARPRGVSFYVIHFPLFVPSGGALVVRRPAKGFHELAGQTGGRYFLLGAPRTALELNPTYDLAPVFRAIAEDLRGQYVLGYYLDESARAAREQQTDISLSRPDGRKLRVHVLRDKYHLSQ